MNKNFNFLVFGRFPTERAYGVHLISNAKSFQKYGNVNIFYPTTTNSKTIKKKPEKYYSDPDNINFNEVEFYDITDTFIYNYLPSILQQFLWLLFTYFFGRKVSKLIPNSENETNWSTSSVLLFSASCNKQNLIFEMHGRARKVQLLFLKKIYKNKFRKKLFISTSRNGFQNLKSKGITENLYFLPNGVDINLFKPDGSKEINTHELNIGYVGQLHTYGVEKGIGLSLMALNQAIKETDNLAYEKIFFSIIGGTKEEHKIIKEKFDIKNFSIKFTENTTQRSVAELIKKLDIGMVPYPNDEHIAKFSSSLKLLEYISSGISVIASDVEANKIFEKDKVGVEYYKVDDLEDLKEKFKFYINKNNYKHLKNQASLNINYRNNLSWTLRTKEIITKI